jgi:hypothetical protein
MALFLYGVYINVFVVMGVHAISRSKAIATVIIPYVIGGLAICGALAALAHYIARSISTLH